MLAAFLAGSSPDVPGGYMRTTYSVSTSAFLFTLNIFPPLAGSRANSRPPRLYCLIADQLTDDDSVLIIISGGHSYPEHLLSGSWPGPAEHPGDGLGDGGTILVRPYVVLSDLVV